MFLCRNEGRESRDPYEKRTFCTGKDTKVLSEYLPSVDLSIEVGTSVIILN